MQKWCWVVVQAVKKNLYMLYEVEPDSSITGGAWYNDHKFDHEFADVLNQYCLKFLEQKVRIVCSLLCVAVDVMGLYCLCVCERERESECMVEIIVPEVRMKQDTGKLYKMALVMFGTSHFLFVVFQCGGVFLCLSVLLLVV